MRIDLEWGQQQLQLEVADEKVIAPQRQAPIVPIADLGAAVRNALDHPFGFPPFRQAIIPDDRIAVVVDESLPHIAALLVPLLQYLCETGIAPQSITLVCAPPSTDQPWLDDLPEELEDIRVEVHDPVERDHLAYLATTRNGRRIYLNRTVVDAEQTILLTRRRYDCKLGYDGGEGSLFPPLSNEETREETDHQLSFDVPDADWPLRNEALEIAWQLGTPLLVQVIEGAGQEICAIVTGTIDSSDRGIQLLNERWRVEVDRAADVVVGTISGDPALHTFADLARAFGSAARVVKPNGRIVLLTDADPELGPSAHIMRHTEETGLLLHRLSKEKPADHEAGFLWAHAAQIAHLSLLSQLDEDTVEELHASALEEAAHVQRIVNDAEYCLFLPDAHKTLAVLRE